MFETIMITFMLTWHW